MEGRVLGLRSNANGLSSRSALSLREIDHLLQSRDLEHSVLRLVAVGHGLLRAKLLDLGKGEVACEPIGRINTIHLAGGLAGRELWPVRNIRSAAEHGLMTGYQDAILRY